MTTLYERIGGEATLTKALMADQKRSEYLKNADIEKQKGKQLQYLIKLAGGPHKYQGKDMREAHKDTKIGQEMFDSTWLLVEKGLQSQQVKADCIAQFKDQFYNIKKQVVNA